MQCPCLASTPMSESMPLLNRNTLRCGTPEFEMFASFETLWGSLALNCTAIEFAFLDWWLGRQETLIISDVINQGSNDINSDEFSPPRTKKETQRGLGSVQGKWHTVIWVGIMIFIRGVNRTCWSPAGLENNRKTWVYHTFVIKDSCFTLFALFFFPISTKKMDVDTFFAYSSTSAASVPRLFPSQIFDIHVTMLLFSPLPDTHSTLSKKRIGRFRS